MAINRVDYGSTTLIDISDTTAVASDVAQGKYFYTNAGVKTAGTASGGGSATLITKSITENGTYNASSDSADGYSQVTVNVPNSYTATISGTGSSSYCCVVFNGNTYYQNGNTFTYHQGDSLNVYHIEQYGGGSYVYVDGVQVDYNSSDFNRKLYTYTLPASDISISLNYGSPTNIYITTGGHANLQTKSVSYTPTTTAQTDTVTADSGYDGLAQVNVNVGAIPSQYIVPSGNKNITANGTGIDVAQYSTVSVAVPFVTYYTGSTTPSSSLGSNGDIYLKTS